MRRLFLMALGATALATTSGANATSFVGSTGGCFGTACTPTSTASLITGGSTLTFNSGTFNVMDSGGIAPIGSGNPPVDTLGLFSLSNTGGPTAISSPFTLLVNFTAPAGVAGNSTYFAAIAGSVTDGSSGGVSIDFDNTPHLFTSASGPFTLSVADLNVTNGDSNTPITGIIRAVPEPASWAMMLLGFAGIGFAMRRRRQPLLAQVA